MLSAHDIVVGYEPGRPVLHGLTLDVPRGAITGLAGPSGCGKSTLAKVMAMLVKPWQGQLRLEGQPVERFGYAAPRAQRTSVGVVFQSPRRSVDPRLTLADTILEPLRTAKVRTAGQHARLAELLAVVGLTGDLLARRPHQVSDGQLQRACLARALALRPAYLICDEMTAMLDAPSSARLVRAVRTVVEDHGTGVLAVSHDEDLLSVWADRVERCWV